MNNEIEKIRIVLKNVAEEPKVMNIENVFRDTYQKQVPLKYKRVEKILELMQLERKESFIYGYKMSNKLIIDSLK